jgi:hypothetical protein
MEAAGEPMVFPADGELDDRLVWVGPDDRGVVLEVIGGGHLLIIHVMSLRLRMS